MAAGRKDVLNKQLRPSPKGDKPLQDWLVPVLYQQESYTPFIPTTTDTDVLDIEDFLEPTVSSLVGFPEEGAYGFIGRDYDILRLERAFRQNNIVLLQGMAGVGKTELACGFSRWLDQTQGRTGKMFFMSFEQGATLSNVVNQVGRELWGDKFSQYRTEQQQQAVLQYLKTQPSLLIWDNFEPVAGFPVGNEPLLNASERDSLQRFLKDLRGGKSWVLITSRREERWLDCGYSLLELRGLREQDVEELAAKILQTAGVDRAKLPSEYLELLKLLGGHPLSLRVVLPHLKTQSPVQLIEALRRGLDTFQGTEEKGRDKSLTVSLDYSFAKLSDRARQHLPFLALFCETVSAELVAYLSNGKPGNPFTQDYLAIFGKNLQKDDWLRILNEAGEAGILENLGRNIYKIHPVLPWYLRQQLVERHPQPVINELEKKAIKFYAGLAARHDREMVSNAQYATTVLMVEEPNLLQNLRLAEQEQDWHSAQLILQALGEMYERQGRIAEFRLLRKRMLGVIGINLIDAKARHQSAFDLWIHLRGIDANELSQNGDLDKASQIYQEIINELVSLNDESVTDSIAELNHNLGYIAEEKRDFTKATAYYKEALNFYENVGNSYNAAYEYLHLGVIAQKQEDMNKADEYYNIARKIYESRNDLYMAAKVYFQIGRLAQDQENITKAISYYKMTLQIYEIGRPLLELAPLYHQIGMALQKTGNFEEASDYYHKSIAIFENNHKFYRAAKVYHQIGRLEHEKNNFEEAINYYNKAIEIFRNKQNWYSAATTLTAWAATLEVQRQWIEALKKYIQAWVINPEQNKAQISIEDIRIKALGRMLKVLGESQFDTAWQEMIGDKCPENLRSAIQAESEENEE